MNFFGHALVASWRSESPAFALGAMLPDLAPMCGAKVPAAADPDAAAGIELHHATDGAFHRLPPFTRSLTALQRRLSGRGLERGPARGAAHVAFELCLDGALLDEDGAVDAYLGAIEVGRGRLRSSFRWQPPEGEARWRLLLDRLVQRGAPLGYRNPDFVTDRVVLVLSRRPLLALDAAAAAELRVEMPQVLADAAGAAPTILAALRAELAA